MNTPRFFRWANWIFWAMWPLIPVALYEATDWSILSVNTFAPVHDICVGNAPRELSAKGRLVPIILCIIDTTFPVVLLGFMHRLIYMGTQQRLLVSKALRLMGYFALAMILETLLELVSYNGALYYLWRTGDLKAWKPVFNVDFLLFGAGLFAWAFRAIMVYAIRMHEDHKLTV